MILNLVDKSVNTTYFSSKMLGKSEKDNRPRSSKPTPGGKKDLGEMRKTRVRVHEKPSPKRSSSQPNDSSKNKENLKINKKYKAIVEKCLLKGTKYVDEDFPATNASLFRSDKLDNKQQHNETIVNRARFSKCTSWQRPENIRMAGKEPNWVLIKEPRPSDICQGRLI